MAMVKSVAIMYVERVKSKQKNKVYEQVLLRESYREPGAPRSQVKHRTLMNLTKYPSHEIRAIELGLKYKHNLEELERIAKGSMKLHQGLSVGAVWTIYTLCKRLGIEKALGTDREGKLGLWQVMARLIDQGSRLSAVRLAQTQAACDVLGMDRGFNENDLYKNLSWMNTYQEKIEKRLYRGRRGRQIPELFFYDVTSSYLEGEKNALAEYGHNRDKKKGKKQIVIGLLCDEYGEPISVEVFRGNTQDMATFSSQLEKAVERFGCERLTFVGDRGMIKSAQIKDLSRAGFHYISAITKPQIKKLIREGMLQLTLFDERICEVEIEGVRYILRRNPQRAEDIANSRQDKKASVEKLLTKKNTYLQEHPRAKPEVALKEVEDRIKKLKTEKWLCVKGDERTLRVVVDEASLANLSRLDGCYVIKTDLPPGVADKKIIHDRYKDLALIEHAFRTFKTGHLEVRPVYVRTEDHTRAHALVVMLSYMIERELRRCWARLDVTVEEGIKELKELCSTEIEINGEKSCQTIPEPRQKSRLLIDAAYIRLPDALTCRGCIVATKTKLPTRRL